MTKAVFAPAVAALGFCFLTAWPSPADAADCGAKNQRPCKLWERIPSCNKGLYEDFGKGRCLAKAVPGKDCGRKNQRPCKIWERIPSCNADMVEDFLKGKCVRDRDAELRRLASKLTAGAAAHQRTMSRIAGCMADPARMNRFQAAVKKKDMKTAQSVANQCVLPADMASLRAAPQGLARAPSGNRAQQYFNSLTIGVSLLYAAMNQCQTRGFEPSTAGLFTLQRMLEQALEGVDDLQDLLALGARP